MTTSNRWPKCQCRRTVAAGPPDAIPAHAAAAAASVLPAAATATLRAAAGVHARNAAAAATADSPATTPATVAATAGFNADTSVLPVPTHDTAFARAAAAPDAPAAPSYHRDPHQYTSEQAHAVQLIQLGSMPQYYYQEPQQPYATPCSQQSHLLPAPAA